MNPQTEENLNEYHLQKLVTEIDSDSIEVACSTILPTSKFKHTSVPYYIVKIIGWFWDLPILAKLIVLAVGFLIGFVILQAALKLIASVMSMALLAGLVYLGYNFFVAGNSPQIKE
ncbi:hypothetical protein IQ247_31490 [Plectonema cf. radiosum LEGE 06105]|uniref:Uncharacterized protein n=1 Tax=Plectonema cf. radiosum LEGE 06105 TaxID=945769 RepID=A0A8J7K8F6_9CYAN|nr:hypothetical protein [Plectonema radiosum]MBE9217122.1 hypothetical protein [Plectonema cf. radiosum LEGE 06105]